MPLLELAARSLLTAIETALAPLEGRQLNGPMRGVIHLAQHRAWEALRSHLGPTAANRIRRECGLLTACYGKDQPQRLDGQKLEQLGLTGYRYINGDGCGLVYHGSAKRTDQHQCETCRKSQTRRWEHLSSELEAKRLAGKTKIAARSFQLGEHTINRPERWYGPCQRCGRRFYSSRPDAKKCEDCRNRSRSPSSISG
jgi:hypothetical protein